MPDTTDPADEPTVTERTLARLERRLRALSTAAAPLAALSSSLHAASLRPDTPIPVPLSLLRALAAALPSD